MRLRIRERKEMAKRNTFFDFCLQEIQVYKISYYVIKKGGHPMEMGRYRKQKTQKKRRILTCSTLQI